MITINHEAKLFYIDGRKVVKLTPKQWMLFVYLYNNKHRYVTADEMWIELWDDSYLPSVVRWQLWNLRKKIAPIKLEFRALHGWKLGDL